MSDPDRQALAARSDGVPLYLEELVRAGTGASMPAGIAAPVPGSVPAALYEPLVARLYQTPDALPVAATAAAAGQSVDHSVLAQTMPIPEEELDSALAALVEAQVLEPVGGPGKRYRFRHELLREVAYELQPPSWRRKVHDRLCDVLLASERRDWHVLASHFERAERHREAAAAYEAPAEWARRRGALEEARAHLTRGDRPRLAAVDDAARDHREVELRLRRGFLAMSAEGAAQRRRLGRLRPLPRARRGRPARRRHVQHADLAVGLRPLARRARPRPADLGDAAPVARRRARGFFRPQNLAGFGMLDWFAGNFAQRGRGARPPATEMLAEMGARRRRRASGSCPTTRPRRCTRTSRWRGSWSATSAAREESLERSHGVAATGSTSRRVRGAPPTRSGSARGCGSRRAGSTARRTWWPSIRSVQRAARLRQLGADRARRRSPPSRRPVAALGFRRCVALWPTRARRSQA